MFTFIQILMMSCMLQLARGLDNPFEAWLDTDTMMAHFNVRLVCLLREAHAPTAQLDPELTKILMADQTSLAASLALRGKRMSQGPQGAITNKRMSQVVEELDRAAGV